MSEGLYSFTCLTRRQLLSGRIYLKPTAEERFTFNDYLVRLGFANMQDIQLIVVSANLKGEVNFAESFSRPVQNYKEVVIKGMDILLFKAEFR